MYYMVETYHYTLFKEKVNKVLTGRTNGNIKKIINLDLNDENLSDLEIIMDEDEKKYVGAVLIEKNHQKNTAIIKDITYIDNKPRHIKKIINALFTDNHFENIIIHVKNGEEKQYLLTLNGSEVNDNQVSINYIQFYC